MTQLPPALPPDQPQEDPPATPEDLAKLLTQEGLDPAKSQRLAQVIFNITATFRSSLVPSARELARVEKAVPGSGARILAAFEEEGAHRRRLQQSSREAEIRDQHEYRALERQRLDALSTDQKSLRAAEMTGRVFAFLICLAFIGAAIACIYIAPNAAGATLGAVLGAGGIAGIVRTFIRGH